MCTVKWMIMNILDGKMEHYKDDMDCDDFDDDKDHHDDNDDWHAKPEPTGMKHKKHPHSMEEMKRRCHEKHHHKRMMHAVIGGSVGLVVLIVIVAAITW